MSKSVLIVDDSHYMRGLIRNAMKQAGFEVIKEASNGESAIDLSMDLQPDLITLDNVLPDMSGIDILRVLKSHGLKSKVVMVSAVGQQSVINEGLTLGAEEYMIKPVTIEDLVSIASDLVN